MIRFISYLQHSCITACFFLTLGSCQLLDKKNEEFRFNPARHKEYNYSLMIASAGSSKQYTNDSLPTGVGTETYDTVNLEFALKNIYYTDSIIICKLTFNDLTIKRPPLHVIIKNGDAPGHLLNRNPLAILDSIGYYIHGRSVQVAISKKGVVKEVDGIDDMMNDIYKATHEPHIKILLRDYVSVNAVQDLLNRIFSVVPQGEVKQDDRWVRNVMLITKAPVKISNLYTFMQRNKDTAFIGIESVISAEQSEGGTVYMKGKQSGKAIVSYSTGMPTLYETRWETVTTTSHQYDYIKKEHFLLKSIPSEPR